MDYKISQVHPYFDYDEIREVIDCFQSAWVTEGPKKEEFINKILEFTGAKFGVLAPNGTQALYLALKAANIGPGDEVLVPDFTFVASGSSVYWTGAKPVFVDVTNDNFNIDPALCEKYITPKTKAIMPVHIYGQAAEMDVILTIAKKYNLKIIEDTAQGLGVYYKERHTGTIGDLGCLSFFADKTITTGGEGGMVLTNNEELYNKLLYFRNHGRIKSSSFFHSEIGYNLRMTDLQCAVGLAQLRKFNILRDKKLEKLAAYKQKLQDVPQIKFLQQSGNSNIVPFRANILADNLEKLIEHLENNKIQTRRFFYPLHKQPFFKEFQYNDTEFPNSNYAYNYGLSLPVHMYITENDIQYLCDKIKEFYG